MTANKAIDLASQILQLAAQPGWHPSRLDGVSLLRQDQDSPPTPVLHEASVVIVAQGCQRGYLGEQVFSVDPGHCLVVATPMQCECDTSLRQGEHLLALGVVEAAGFGDVHCPGGARYEADAKMLLQRGDVARH